MPLDALITHHIACDGQAPASVRLGQAPLAADAQAGELVDALKRGFLARLSREHGCFADGEEPAQLPRLLNAFSAGELDFAALTAELINHWREALDADPIALDVDVICFAEKQGDRRLFHLLVAGARSAFAVDPAQGITTTRYLDLGASLFGIKVDLHEWQTAKHYAYLTCVPPQGNRKLADGFAALTGFTRGLDKADSTDAFLTGVEAFARQVDPEQANDFRSQVVDYCDGQARQDAPVDLAELARNVEGIDGERFTRFMADYAPADDQALMMDQRRLRRYVKFTGRERDLAISFSSTQLNSRVHYNPDRDSLTIDGIPRALRDQLLRHLSS